MTLYTVKFASGTSIRVTLTWLGATPLNKKDVIRNVKKIVAEKNTEEIVEIRRTMNNQLIWKKDINK